MFPIISFLDVQALHIANALGHAHPCFPQDPGVAVANAILFANVFCCRSKEADGGERRGWDEQGK